MDNLNFNIFNIVIISGVLHGIIFSFIVFVQKKYNTNNIIFLGLVVLFLSLSNFQYWLIDTNLILKYPTLKFIYVPWQWLVLPMFYFYVYKFIGRKGIDNKMRLLLITPFIIVFIIHLVQLIYKYLVDSSYYLPSLLERGIYLYIDFLSIPFNIIVIYYCYSLIMAHEKDDRYNLKWIKSETDWLKKLIYTGFTICAFWIIAISITTIFNLNQSYMFYPMWIGISFLVYWIGYVGIQKSQLLRNRIELRQKRITELTNSSKKPCQKPDSFNKIEAYINDNNLYLNPHLTLNMLSESLNLSEGYISQLINKNANKYFNDYINTLRIEDTKKMLSNPDYDNYTIESIGLESGFNSKSSFYQAFKKHTNKTPVDYKKSVLNH